MAWRMQEIDDEEARAQDLTDQEMAALYVAMYAAAKNPFDDRNPLFCAYRKLADVWGRLLESAE